MREYTNKKAPSANNMGRSSRIRCRWCPLQVSLYTILYFFLLLSLLSLILNKVDEIVYQITQTKIITGANLRPTPWQGPQEPYYTIKNTYVKALHIIKCKYLSCLSSQTIPYKHHHFHNNSTSKCPSFYQWIHEDLRPWAHSGISQSQIMEARKYAAFRIVIVDGRIYVDMYYACTKSRVMFTVWGFLHLLRRYPGMVPDVDLMFDCMDIPLIERANYIPGKRWPPPPLFRYCTDENHFDIPFPDWSFWGWPEINIPPWDEEFRHIKEGSETLNWTSKRPYAHWRGSVFSQARVREELANCNDSSKWGAEIVIHHWREELKRGYKTSRLEDQCKHRYKIYAEGITWSVSLKYILSCGSPSLLISPQYQDFFSRALIPKENYWPISHYNLCNSIKFAVEWGNANPKEAEAIGKEGQDLMRSLSMEKVYDYMYHLINEYAKLQKFKPTPPPSAQEMCIESIICFSDAWGRRFLQKTKTYPSLTPPCSLPIADHNLIKNWVRKKIKVINEVEEMEKLFTG